MGSILLVVLFAFLLGAILLALGLGYRGSDADRAERESGGASTRPWRFDGPSFFARLDPDAPAVSRARAIRDLEAHVRREQAAAAAFVSHPSLVRLYPGYSARMDSRTTALERYLRDETLRVAAFVAAPSVDGLVLEPGAVNRLTASIGSTLEAIPDARGGEQPPSGGRP